MFISSEGDVLCHVLVIVILSADVFFGFGSQFHGFFHILHRTVLVAFQQLDAASLMIGLCKVGIDFDGFIIHSDGFVEVFLCQEKLSQQQICLFIKRIERQYLIETFLCCSSSPVAASISPFNNSACSSSGLRLSNF